MSGYCNFSMSNNAVAAYEDGKRPRSKWDKGSLISVLSEIYDGETMAEIKKFSTEVLRRVFLQRTEWHHTSSYYNETDFCEVYDGFKSYYALNLCTSVKKDIACERDEKKHSSKCSFMALCKYLEWEGTRKHPKAIEKEGYCWLDSASKWAYFDGFKKSTSARGFFIVKTFDRAPRGTSAEFKKIKKALEK